MTPMLRSSNVYNHRSQAVLVRATTSSPLFLNTIHKPRNIYGLLDIYVFAYLTTGIGESDKEEK